MAAITMCLPEIKATRSWHGSGSGHVPKPCFGEEGAAEQGPRRSRQTPRGSGHGPWGQAAILKARRLSAGTFPPWRDGLIWVLFFVVVVLCISSSLLLLKTQSRARAGLAPWRCQLRPAGLVAGVDHPPS